VVQDGREETKASSTWDRMPMGIQFTMGMGAGPQVKEGWSV
jgi:hypothetical protein